MKVTLLDDPSPAVETTIRIEDDRGGVVVVHVPSLGAEIAAVLLRRHDAFYRGFVQSIGAEVLKVPDPSKGGA